MAISAQLGVNPAELCALNGGISSYTPVEKLRRKATGNLQCLRVWAPRASIAPGLSAAEGSCAPGQGRPGPSSPTRASRVVGKWGLTLAAEGRGLGLGGVWSEGGAKRGAGLGAVP